MQLPVTGQPLHTRSLTMKVTVLEGGGWRVRGHVIDIRKTGFAAMPTSLQPAGLIHSMSIDLGVNPETLCIESLETDQPVVAVEPSRVSGGECCRDPAGNLKALVGEHLGPAFSKTLSSTFGGPRGCSHLLALFFFMAAAVPRAHEFERERAATRGTEREPGECIFQRSFSLDGLQDETGDVELSVQVGDYHLLPAGEAKETAERLEHEHDIRLYVKVQTSDMTLRAFRAIERDRDYASLSTAAWRERPTWGHDLIGTPLLGGFAARVLQSCSGDPTQRLLCDTLLQLAPGHYQVLAAFADQWAAGGTTPGGNEKNISPASMTANCYMWRAGGALGPI